MVDNISGDNSSTKTLPGMKLGAESQVSQQFSFQTVFSKVKWENFEKNIKWQISEKNKKCPILGIFLPKYEQKKKISVKIKLCQFLDDTIM